MLLGTIGGFNFNTMPKDVVSTVSTHMSIDFCRTPLKSPLKIIDDVRNLITAFEFTAYSNFDSSRPPTDLNKYRECTSVSRVKRACHSETEVWPCTSNVAIAISRDRISTSLVVLANSMLPHETATQPPPSPLTTGPRPCNSFCTEVQIGAD